MQPWFGLMSLSARSEEGSRGFLTKQMQQQMVGGRLQKCSSVQAREHMGVLINEAVVRTVLEADLRTVLEAVSKESTRA